MSEKTETKGIAPKIANGFQKKNNQAISVRILLLSITESGVHWQTGQEFTVSVILKVEYNGEYLTIAELAEKSGLDKRKLQRKIYEQHKNAYEAIHDIIQTEKRKVK